MKLFIKRLLKKITSLVFPGNQNSVNTVDYWENRYRDGKNSGSGSYGPIAQFKADTINNFIKENNIKSIIEFGCGDGNQLSLLNFERYVGLDVSKKSIEICKEKFQDNKKCSFFLYEPFYFVDRSQYFNSELTLSLDVIYHLFEDDVFDKYMEDLFNASSKYVIIFSSNTDEQGKLNAKHVRNRKFSDWIKENRPNCRHVKTVQNQFPNDKDYEVEAPDFYFYQKD